MIPPPLISTLFPYTTLFRSHCDKAELLFYSWDRKSAGTPPICPEAIGKYTHSESCRKSADRKSTRLNSSHTVISYAVFCLKKKNKRSANSPYEILAA